MKRGPGCLQPKVFSGARNNYKSIPGSKENTF